MSLAKFWDEKVPKRWKHLVEHTKGEKAKRIVNRVAAFYDRALGEEAVGTVLDWGCGGGLVGDWLLEEGLASQVVCADMSEDSLASARKFLEPHGDKAQFVLVPEHPEDAGDVPFKDIDMVLCHDVIHHFPGVEYFKEMAKLWASIGPRYMMLNFKVSNELHEENADGYFEGTQYLRALTMPEELVSDTFAELGYEISKRYTFNTAGNPHPKAYVLLKRVEE